MEPHQRQTLDRVAAWTGWSLNSPQAALLRRFHDWLATEAVLGGGIGPAEVPRLWERHVLDSLLFARGATPPLPPSRLIDLGTGVGLPGIPLAILWPDTEVVLVDRSGRRIALVRRALRVLGLANTRAVLADAAIAEEGPADLVVSRALGPPERVFAWAKQVADAGGKIVVGGSWIEPPTRRAGEELIEVPPEVLDRPIWLRIMAAP